MNFHVYSKSGAPKIILIHGTLTPWQMWEEQIKHLRNKYHVTVVALDAHEEDTASEFISIELEARQIEKYCLENYGGEVFAVCGVSMGGAIASIMWRNGIVKIHNLVMDSAPIMPMGKIAAKVMTNNYLSIIRKSKKRDPKTLENFKKHFLPEKYLEPFLKIADNMSETSVRNMIYSVCGCELCKGIPHNETRILYIHGTKGTEIFQMKCSTHLKKNYPEAKVICFRKTGHCEAAIYKPLKWLEVVEKFLQEENNDERE